MMKNLITLIGILLLCSCEETTQLQPLQQPHFVSYVEYTASGQPNELFVSGVLRNGYIQFFDKKFGLITQYGKYYTGSFSFNTETHRLVLHFPVYGKFVMTVKEQASATEGRPDILLQGNNKEGGMLKMVLQYDDYLAQQEVSLLEPKRNTWRAKPAKRQTDQQLRNRVVGQLDCIADYFRGLKQRDDDRFDAAFLNPPLYFYTDGLGILPPAQRSSWNAMFFDSTDAAIAYGFVEDALYSVQTSEIKEKLPLDRYNNVLQQMQDYFNKQDGSGK